MRMRWRATTPQSAPAAAGAISGRRAARREVLRATFGAAGILIGCILMPFMPVRSHPGMSRAAGDQAWLCDRHGQNLPTQSAGLGLLAFGLVVLGCDMLRTVTRYRSGAGRSKLQAGDKVSVTVYGEPAPSGACQIDQRGLVSLPQAGTVMAAGQDTDQVGANLGEQASQPIHERKPRWSYPFRRSRDTWGSARGCLISTLHPTP
jgi:hypothetical protein